MLGRYYRFTAKNELGQTISSGGITVNARRWRFASDGSVEYEGSEGSVFTLGSGLPNGSYASGAGVDNGTDKWIGGDFEFVGTAPASSNGNVILFFERSTDGSDFPDNGLGEPVAVLNFTTNGTKRLTFAL